MSDSYQHAKRIWFELLELEPTEREDRLAELAARDPALASRLRAQWDARSRVVPLLDRCNASPEGPALPGYRVLREIGRGGMGRVWLAERDLGGAVQRVAVKQIAHAGWDADNRRRFERERRILASLHHPHIAALVDGGTDAAGAPWLATAYVDGERLDAYVRRPGIALADRVRLLRKVALAVAHAHRQLVVHRDLKPGNILVESGDEPRLLDFGIARLFGDEPITTTGTGQMTLRYASPEQVAGTERDGSVASDIHALGVLLYELVAGAPPHADVVDPAALLNAVMTRDPPAPSRLRNGRRSARDGDLDAIVLKALRKRAEDRYPTADALASDLARWLEGEPVEARLGERGYRARAFVRRRWPAVAAGLAVLVAGTGFMVYDGVRTRQQLAAVADERDKAQALASYFADLFDGVQPSEVERGDVSAAELLQRSVRSLATDDVRPAETRAALLVAASSALGRLGQYQRSLATADLALELLSTVPAPDPATLAGAWIEHAGSQSKLGHAKAAWEGIEHAAAVLADATDPALAITVRQQQAIYAEEAGHAEKAPAVYADIIALTAGHFDDPRMLRSHVAAQFNLALVEMRSDPATGEARLRKALQITQSHRLADPSTAIKIKSALARSLVDQRRLDEARPLHAEALREARGWFTRNDRWVDVITYHYAAHAILDGRSEEAIRLLDESLQRPLATRADTDKPAWSTRSLRATASLVAGAYADAAGRLEDVLAWRARVGQQSGKGAAFERLQLAYARCRLAPGAAALAGLRGEWASWSAPATWQRWFAESLVPSCERAAGERSGSPVRPDPAPPPPVTPAG
jgi:serine/threonine-protein kinase